MQKKNRAQMSSYGYGTSKDPSIPHFCLQPQFTPPVAMDRWRTVMYNVQTACYRHAIDVIVWV